MSPFLLTKLLIYNIHLYNRGLFVCLLVDQSTNWSTNCSFSALILVDQMSILVDELIDQQTNK